MTERKGDIAARALAAETRDPDLARALDDLVRLAQHDALEGVAALAGERLRQVAAKGHTASRDAELHVHGWLPMEGVRRVVAAYCKILDGSGDWLTALDAMREAGALFAAETDRLTAAISASAPEGAVSGA